MNGERRCEHCGRPRGGNGQVPARHQQPIRLSPRQGAQGQGQADAAHRQVGPMNDANGFILTVGLIVLTVLIGWIFDKLDKWR